MGFDRHWKEVVLDLVILRMWRAREEEKFGDLDDKIMC